MTKANEIRKLQSQGVHHITLVGADRQTSIDFWEGVLGMPFISLLHSVGILINKHNRKSPKIPLGGQNRNRDRCQSEVRRISGFQIKGFSCTNERYSCQNFTVEEILVCLERAFAVKQMSYDNRKLKDEIQHLEGPSEAVIASEKMRMIFDILKRTA